MCSSLETLDVSCDAPPYEIVRASEKLPLRSPLDVRWCHTGHCRRIQKRARALCSLLPWNWFRGRTNDAVSQVCTCGAPFPLLDDCTFTTPDYQVLAEYRIGQCRRCRTIYWEEALLPRRALAAH